MEEAIYQVKKPLQQVREPRRSLVSAYPEDYNLNLKAETKNIYHSYNKLKACPTAEFYTDERKKVWTYYPDNKALDKIFEIIKSDITKINTLTLDNYFPSGHYEYNLLPEINGMKLYYYLRLENYEMCKKNNFFSAEESYAKIVLKGYINKHIREIPIDVLKHFSTTFYHGICEILLEEDLFEAFCGVYHPTFCNSCLLQNFENRTRFVEFMINHDSSLGLKGDCLTLACIRTAKENILEILLSKAFDEDRKKFISDRFVSRSSLQGGILYQIKKNGMTEDLFLKLGKICSKEIKNSQNEDQSVYYTYFLSKIIELYNYNPSFVDKIALFLKMKSEGFDVVFNEYGKDVPIIIQSFIENSPDFFPQIILECNGIDKIFCPSLNKTICENILSKNGNFYEKERILFNEKKQEFERKAEEIKRIYEKDCADLSEAFYQFEKEFLNNIN